MDLLIANGTVVTMDARRRVLHDTDVLIQDGRIVRVEKGMKRGRGARRRIDAEGLLVIPGLIHGHLHACQTLFRGHADGLELLDWLAQRIWPFEAAHDADSMRASADLTFAELLKSGATAALDMGSVYHTDAIFESARDAGFRLTGGKAMMDAPGSPLTEPTDRSLAESLALVERWHGAEGGRLRYAFAPRFILSCTDRLLREVARLARERSLRVHTHASESRAECDEVRRRFGRDNIEQFGTLDLLGPHVTLAHCVWPTDAERALLARSRTVVCHCPGSNLKLASGIAPIPELLAEGVAVALGADGAPCNNTLDAFQEMRLAALLHLPRKGPKAMPPMQVLELATLGGARALGLEAELGSLEEGKRADLTLVRRDGLQSSPSADDPVSQLVYSGRGSDVLHVVVDGRPVVLGGRLVTLDEAEVRTRAEAQWKRLRGRAQC